ncbi:MAG: carboxypeptidase M32 [Pseudomonadota bacterium]
MSGALEALFAHDAQTSALGQIMGRLHWDQETVMPPGSAAQRAEEIGALEAVLHARRQDPRLGDWLSEADPESETDAARLDLIARDYQRARALPADLAVALARAASTGQGIWAKARADEDVAAFLPALSEMIALKREAADAWCAAAGTQDRYDALVEDYEPGLTGAEIAALFDRMRPRLVALRDAVLGKAAAKAPLQGQFAQADQLRFAALLAERFGYDLGRGRIDLAVHPFSSGSGADVRITTRVDESDPFNCFYSTIHEVGHASYEQNVAAALGLTRLGQGVSMGVHESQSRIYENQLGRSEAFCTWMHGAMSETFGAFQPEDAAQFYATVNAVRAGYIRTEADELHYNLHVMLRFDLERDLIQGGLDVADLNDAWNARFAADFGVAVDRPSHGLLQDVHWSCGLFGYFPTYTLGNVYAGCLHEALRRDLPALDEDLARGDTGAATAWLGERVQRHGASKAPRQVIEEATGAPVSEAPLLDYLEAKFGALYSL